MRRRGWHGSQLGSFGLLSRFMNQKSLQRLLYKRYQLFY